MSDEKHIFKHVISCETVDTNIIKDTAFQITDDSFVQSIF
jgi:hypothetical protein